MKKCEELRQEVATPLPLGFLSTCPLLTTAGEVNPMVADDRNPGKAVVSEADPALTSREAGHKGAIRGTGTVTAPNPAADREPESGAATDKTPLQNDRTAEEATEAVLRKELHPVAFATDGKRTVFAPGITTKSVSSSILAVLLLPSL